MRIQVDDLSGPEIRGLLEEHLANMHELSPPESVHALDLAKLRGPDITFWTVWHGDLLLGCGALKELAPAHGEVKSMRTPKALRGRGAARAVLATIAPTPSACTASCARRPTASTAPSSTPMPCASGCRPTASPARSTAWTPGRRRWRMSFTNFGTGNSHSFGGKYLELVPGEAALHQRLRRPEPARRDGDHHGGAHQGVGGHRDAPSRAGEHSR
jgi:hypothetical protein